MKNKCGYFEVFDGCAGDMLAGSLIDAGLDLKLLKKELDKIPLTNYTIEIKKTKRHLFFHHFITATKFLVVLEKEEKFRKYTEIIKIIQDSSLSENIKKEILKIFYILAKVEAKAHREKIENVHFHQIGQTDAIVEIASVVIGLDILGIKNVYSSPIGISNPAPATIELIKGLPVIFRNIPYEISTPTGVSILKGICKFKNIENGIIVEGNGYGAGERKEPSPNILKFIYGKQREEEKSIYVVETNIDDMNPLIFENLYEKLFKAGAVDVSVFTGIGKKNRPVFNLCIMVEEKNFEKVKEIVFSETTTIGFRFRKEKRITLEREIKEVKTKWGRVRVKVSFSGEKIYNISPEYEDCMKISKKSNIPLKQVLLEVNNLSKNLTL